jgi:hypothetical protein
MSIDELLEQQPPKLRLAAEQIIEAAGTSDGDARLILEAAKLLSDEQDRSFQMNRQLKAADKMHIAACEFVNDWRKGDFSLSSLARCDANSLADYASRYGKARYK